jgi:hypothetical protein
MQGIAAWMTAFDDRLDFRVSKRGWCYLAEEHAGLPKGDFKKFERLIDVLRKQGLVPVGIVAEDGKRAADNLPGRRQTPDEYADEQAELTAESWETYEPGNFWDYQKYYVEVMVEKVDLRNLFVDVCAEFQIVIWNAGGWSDINSRVAALRRFQEHHKAGRRCVLPYCGDHDPAGLNISGFIRSNLLELAGAAGWEASEDNLLIDRFGLNLDFIRRHRLSWIAGLETGSGENLADEKHRDHKKDYVQSYLKAHGAKKVEANTLVTRADAGRALCRATIEKYIDADGVAEYEADREEAREAVRKALPGAVRRALRRPP